MTAAPESLEPRPSRFADVRRTLADNPAIVLVFVFVGLFVLTDVVNRAQSGEAFLTAAQVSGPGPLLALTACGVGVTLWVPQGRAVLLGASTPVALFALHQVVPPGAAADVVSWWLTDPWWVLAGATLLCVAGRRR